MYKIKNKLLRNFKKNISYPVFLLVIKKQKEYFNEDKNMNNLLNKMKLNINIKGKKDKKKILK